MKITYLGTAAAEGFPAVFCNCKHCQDAKRLGGKNIRTRSQALINDDLLIDLPADTYTHFLNNSIDGDKIRYLLVTHSHPDHFYEKELEMRHGAFAHNMREEKLKICCGTGVANIIQNTNIIDNGTIDFEVIKPFSTAVIGDYAITALPAKHYHGDGALFYIIKGEKTILYSHDTGFFYEEVFDFIKNKGYVFDLVSMDCTYVDLPVSDDGTHMGIDNINRALKRLEEMGAVTDKTQKVINHFSHNGAPIHQRLEDRVREYGYIVAYDGLSVKL